MVEPMKTIAAALTLLLWTGTAAAGSITLFSEYRFTGESVTLRRDVENFAHYPPWNDRAVSLVVNSGTWEVCRHAGYRDCAIVRGGQVADLGQLGMYRQISSIRALDSFGRRDDLWGHDRWRRDPWDDPWNRPPPPPWGPPHWSGSRDRDRIIWKDDRWGGDEGGWNSVGNLSRCQARVYEGFFERFGYRARAQFYGASDEGTVRWDGETWRFACTDGRVHIWQ